MTERRYYYSDDVQGQAQVLSCTPAEAGAYAVELDATLFHPQGGGQPSDVGTLGGVAVLRVQQQGDTVLHFTAAPLPLGPVTLQIDEAQRRLHARWHSGGHLIGWLGETRGGGRSRRIIGRGGAHHVRARAGCADDRSGLFAGGAGALDRRRSATPPTGGGRDAPGRFRRTARLRLRRHPCRHAGRGGRDRYHRRKDEEGAADRAVCAELN